MTDITLGKASASTDGRGIKVAASSTPGTLLHTYWASATDFEVVDVIVTNTDTVERTITFENGGTTSPDDLRKGVVQPSESRSFSMFIGRNAGALRAFGSAANVLTCHVIVRSVTP